MTPKDSRDNDRAPQDTGPRFRGNEPDSSPAQSSSPQAHQDTPTESRTEDSTPHGDGTTHESATRQRRGPATLASLLALIVALLAAPLTAPSHSSFDQANLCGGLISIDSLRDDLFLDFTPERRPTFEYEYSNTPGNATAEEVWSCHLEEMISSSPAPLNPVKLDISYGGSMFNSDLANEARTSQSGKWQPWTMSGHQGQGWILQERAEETEKSSRWLNDYTAVWVYPDDSVLHISIESIGRPDVAAKNFQALSEKLVETVPVNHVTAGETKEEIPLTSPHWDISISAEISEEIYTSQEPFDEANVCGGLVTMDFLENDLDLPFHPLSRKFQYDYIHATPNIDPSSADGRLLDCKLRGLFEFDGEQQIIEIEYWADHRINEEGFIKQTEGSEGTANWTIDGQQGQGRLSTYPEYPDETTRLDKITYYGEWLYPDGSYVEIRVRGANIAQDEFAAAAEDIVRDLPEHHKTSPKAWVEYEGDGGTS